MKPFQLFVVLYIVILFSSCSKNEIQSTPVGTLMVTNAVIGGGNIKLNTDINDSILKYNAGRFGLAIGNNAILLHSTANPSVTYHNAPQQIANGGIYSLFLCGQTAPYDAVFVTEMLPPYFMDSTIGVRVINLSPNSTPVNITLASAPATNLYSGIAYKQLTSITKLPLNYTTTTAMVTFQVRDGLSNALLASYVLPATAASPYANISILNSRNRNLTLVVKGLAGMSTGNDAFGIFPVANY